MQVLVDRGCGLDIGQALIVACVLVGGHGKLPKKCLRNFGTTTRELLALRDWLESLGVSHVAMESTGVYWKPVHNILEGHFEIIVANARHIKAVPGRKTDVRDSEWIAELLRFGLISPSFVPTQDLRELRDLLRYRRKVVDAQTAERNRVLKLLETANVKLASVASDVFGVSGRLMLKALIEGNATPAAMAQLARGRLRRRLGDLELALEGRVTEHHRFLLSLQLSRLDDIESTVSALDARIDQKVEPLNAIVERLTQIPGVDRIVAITIVAEMGVDMSVFRTAPRLASWAGICPGNDESAGKRKNARSNKGNVYLKVALVQAAMATRNTKSYLGQKFRHLARRRGKKRAAVAVGHKILVAAYHMLATGQPYVDLGEAYLDRLDVTKTASALVRRLNRLGYQVELKGAVA